MAVGDEEKGLKGKDMVIDGCGGVKRKGKVHDDSQVSSLDL